MRMSVTQIPKRTPLYDRHLAAGAKMVEFAGWMMPIQYKGIREEHQNVRTNVGIFDVSHMGEIRFLGDKSLESLEWLTSNAVGTLPAGKAQYGLLPNERGGIVDDIIVYCIEPRSNYLVCVNAANRQKDFDWMVANNKGAEIIDESEKWSQIAVQGPKAPALLKDVLGTELKESFTHQSLLYNNARTIVARTGYTGELGAEVFIEAHRAPDLWDELLNVGTKYGVMPIGLGARDTLRTEMKYSLYGHEIDDATNPLEAGLGWAVKIDAKNFIGRKAILEAKERGLHRKLVGFSMIDSGIPRQGYKLFSVNDKVEIGYVTSGTLSPTLAHAIGIGYVTQSQSTLGNEIAVEIRGRMVKAKIVETPFVKAKKEK